MTSNGNGQHERSHFCERCGHFLCATTVPLGTHGTVRIQCPERACGRPNLVRIGEQPEPRVDREAWVAEIELLRRYRRSTRF